MNTTRYRYIPLALAFAVMLVPVHDLVKRVVISRSASASAQPEPKRAVVPRTDRYRSATPPALDLPGTVLHAHRSAQLDRFTVEATPLQLAELLSLLNRSGTANSIIAERAADRWIVHIEHHRAVPAIRDSSEEFPVHDLARVFVIPADESRKEQRPRVTEKETHTEQTPVRGPFGIVEFSSGRRLTWRWNTDLLFLEDLP